MSAPRTSRRAVIAVLGLSALAACEAPTGTPAAGETSEGALPLPVDVLATGLEAPWSIAVLDEVLLVSERDTGQVLEVADDGSTRVLGTIDGVTPRGEGGLLGIAVHEGMLYSYSTGGQENRVLRCALTGAPGSLGLGEQETLLEAIPAATVHHGGRIAFGPDGMLYVTVGDAGDAPTAQDRAALTGKILRLTPEGSIPGDNPFEGSPVYSLGHRNPQGVAWGEDGTMYASEFGQDTWDELNVIEAGGNYGWPEVEGIARDERYIDPVQQWEPADASPSGIAVADGSIWIANLRGERLREVPLEDLGSSREHLVGEHGRLRDVVLAPDGTLRVLTSATDGRGDPGPRDDRILVLAPR